MDRGLRILVLATDAHGGFGGIAQYNRDVVEAMCGYAHVNDVVVLTRAKGESGFKHPAKAKYDLASTGGVKKFITRAAAHALTRFDLVYCAHINLLPVAAAIARARSLPLVLAIYGIDAWQPPSSLSARFALRAVSRVISISQITLDRFLAWSGIATEKCAVVPNAIHMEEFSVGPKDNDLARRLGVEARPVILTFGRMVGAERYKGFDEIIDVMPRLLNKIPNLIYVAAGDGSDKNRLEAKAKALGLDGSVIFPGRVREEEKADLYRLSNAYVMPSSGEGFGFVVLEALACGIPVVASSTDGTREAVRNGVLGLVVDPADPQALESAILDALAHPKGILPELEYFSAENFELRLKAVLNTMVTFET